MPTRLQLMIGAAAFGLLLILAYHARDEQGTLPEAFDGLRRRVEGLQAEAATREAAQAATHEAELAKQSQAVVDVRKGASDQRQATARLREQLEVTSKRVEDLEVRVHALNVAAKRKATHSKLTDRRITNRFPPPQNLTQLGGPETVIKFDRKQCPNDGRGVIWRGHRNRTSAIADPFVVCLHPRPDAISDI